MAKINGICAGQEDARAAADASAGAAIRPDQCQGDVAAVLPPNLALIASSILPCFRSGPRSRRAIHHIMTTFEHLAPQSLNCCGIMLARIDDARLRESHLQAFETPSNARNWHDRCALQLSLKRWGVREDWLLNRALKRDRRIAAEHDGESVAAVCAVAKADVTVV